MPNVKVKHKETILDVAVLQSGDMTGIFEMALLNNISLTKDLKSGDELIPGAVINEGVVSELTSRIAKPASAIISPPEEILEGIGYWRVFGDFIVQ